MTEYDGGWVFYDAQCSFCVGWTNRARRLLLQHGFHLVPLQATWVKARLGLDDASLMSEMKLLLPNGHVLGGADALLHIAKSIWWAWPLFAVSIVPGVKPVFRAIYRRIARNRHCLSGACPIPVPTRHHHRHLTSSFYELP